MLTSYAATWIWNSTFTPAVASAEGIRAEHKFQFLSHYSWAISAARAPRSAHSACTAQIKWGASQMQTLEVLKLMYSIKVKDCNCEGYRNYAGQTIPSKPSLQSGQKVGQLNCWQKWQIAEARRADDGDKRGWDVEEGSREWGRKKQCEGVKEC